MLDELVVYAGDCVCLSKDGRLGPDIVRAMYPPWRRGTMSATASTGRVARIRPTTPCRRERAER